ncbi:helix-turn-helix domain-containing protein [Streptomyces mexicanus]|uniref:helix-turn-helix domain-containing protein n=1 Tax=Streptomyces mexicanus TaxID=178566 RepID=UPI00364B6C2F
MPRLYRPEEIAETLGCSAWWVKDRAHRRLIPHTRVGRAYRFTAEHLAEIIRIHEEPAPLRSDRTSTPTPPSNPIGTRAPATPQTGPSTSPTPRLRARPPRRSQYGTAA